MKKKQKVVKRVFGYMHDFKYVYINKDKAFSSFSQGDEKGILYENRKHKQWFSSNQFIMRHFTQENIVNYYLYCRWMSRILSENVQKL